MLKPCVSRSKRAASTMCSAASMALACSRNSLGCAPNALCSASNTGCSSAFMRLRPVLELLALDALVQRHDAVDQRLGARRAAGHIHIHGHDLIHTLHNGIVIEHTTTRGAVSHR